MTLQEEILSFVFADSMEQIIVFKADGSIVSANNTAKEETGYLDNIAAQNIADIYPLVLHNSEGCVTGREGFEFGRTKETSCYCKNQTCFPVLLKIIKYDNNEGTRFISYASNIKAQKMAVRQQKSAMEELEEATKMKNEFMANVTHELRTPVNGMKGMAANLLDTSLNAGQRETVGIIIRCCENMTKIINDLLDFSKIEAGKLNIEKREFNFKKFLDDTLAIHAPKINEKGLRLMVNVGSDIPTYIIGDELRLGQIINNLFSNAVKFTQSGHIAFEIVNTAQTETEVELFFMVIDTGIGIAKEDLDKLFKSFSQVDGSITRRFGGTGLGLAITKQLVEMMEGTIHVESEKDKGSTFSFSARFGIGKGIKEAEQDRPFKYDAGKYVYGNTGIVPQADYQGASAAEDTDEDKLKKAAEILEKLTICVEMGTWAKAETFAGTIKNLMPADNQDLKRNAFRLEMNVRKEDHDKTVQQIEILSKLLKG